MNIQDNRAHVYSRIGLVLVLSASLFIAAQWGHTQTVPEKQPGALAPVVLSGSDLGFRVESQKGDTAFGTFVVRINGQWVTAASAGSLKPLSVK